MAIRRSRIDHEVFPGTSTGHQLVCQWPEVLLVQSPRPDHGHGYFALKFRSWTKSLKSVHV